MYILNIFSWRNENLRMYDGLHITFIILAILLSILFIFIGRKHNEKQTKNVVLIFGLIYLFLETYKLLFYNVFDEEQVGFTWYQFSFQYCSTILYACIICQFVSERFRHYFYCYIAFYSLFAGLVVMIYPNTVIVPEITITCQSYVWHSGMVVLGCYLLSARKMFLNMVNMKPAFIIFVIGVGIALILNVSFELLRPITHLDDTFNMYFLNPFIECTTPVLSFFFNIHWSLGIISYIFGITLAAFVVRYTALFIYNLIDRRRIYAKK